MERAEEERKIEFQIPSRLPAFLCSPTRSATVARIFALAACVAALVVGGCGPSKPPGVPGAGDGAAGDGAKPELVVQTGHTINVLDVTFSPKGDLVASASADSTIKLWDVRTQRELRTLVGHLGPVYTIAFDRDGKRIASGAMDDTVRVWDVGSGRELARLATHKSWVRKVLWAPTGNLLLSADLSGVAKLWDLDSKAERLTLKVGDPTALAFSPDGTLLGGSAESITTPACALWEIPSGKELRRMGVAAAPSAIAFSPDGKRLLVGSSGGQLELFEVPSGNKLGATKGHEGYVRSLGFRPGAAELATGGDDNVSLWDDTMSRRLHSFAGAADRLAFSPDGKLLATTGANEVSGEVGKYFGGSRTVVLWDVASRAKIGSLDPLIPVAGSGDISNVVSPFSVAFHPQKPIVATAGLDGLVRLWDLRRGGAPRVLAGHERPIISLAFNARGNKLASGDFGAVNVWLLRTGKLVQHIETAGRSVGFDATGNLLVTGNMDGTVTQWNANTGRKMFEQSVHQGAVVGMQFLADNSAFISAGEADATIGFWEGSEQLRSTGQVRAHAAHLHALAVSSNKVVAAGGGYSQMMVTSNPTLAQDASITLAYFAGKPRIEQLRGHEGTVETLAFSPDGKLLASGAADNSARLWDVAAAKEIGKLEGHTANVCGVSFSGDGRLLATVDHGGVVRLWTVAQRELVATLAAFDSESYVIATADNHYTASKEGLRAVAFRVGSRAVPFEQYDLRLNRPDLVLARMGYAPKEVLDTFYQAYLKRLRKMGLSEQELGAGYSLPQLRLTSAPPPLTTTERKLRLQVQASDPSRKLRALLAYVNDVPVFGVRGIDLSAASSSSAEQEVELTLSQGRNKLQLSVLNDQGTESLKETFLVSYQGAAPPRDLWVLTIGVSRYQDSKLDLAYAAKDAEDVGQAFEQHGQHFGKVRVMRILDHEVTRENVTGAKKFLLQSKVDDQVVLFLAGHGMLDKSKEYYFVPSDFVRADPPRRGLTFDLIESLLDGIPARRKLLLIDSCHSGEVDDDTPLGSGSASAALLSAGTGPSGALGSLAAAAASAGAPSAQARAVKSFRGLELWTEVVPQKPASSDGALQELFADLRRGAGAMVISSAGGAEYALEADQFSNGVFTFALLEGLRDGKADRDRDGQIRVSELREYVAARVQALTDGEQHPTSRRENLFDDFPVF